MRLVCSPDDYTVVNVNWGLSTVIAQGVELKNDAGETWATAHSVNVRFDDGEAQQETWWLSSDGNYSRPRQAYWRGAHPGFIQELRGVDILTLWANTASGQIEAEFDVRNLDYVLSQNPKHCQEPDAYGKWVYDEWENDSGDTGYEFFLYAESPDDVYISVWCYENNGDKAAQIDWGNFRPSVSADGYEIKQPDGTLHSTAHSVRVRYGDGLAQPENWQLLSAAITRHNRSLPQGYKGDAIGKIFQYQQVDALTVWTDTDAGPIRVEFDVRRLDKALARLDRHCQ